MKKEVRSKPVIAQAGKRKHKPVSAASLWVGAALALLYALRAKRLADVGDESIIKDGSGIEDLFEDLPPEDVAAEIVPVQQDTVAETTIVDEAADSEELQEDVQCSLACEPCETAVNRLANFEKKDEESERTSRIREKSVAAVSGREKRIAARVRRKRLERLLLFFFVGLAGISGYKVYGYVQASQAQAELSEELRAEYKKVQAVAVERKDRFDGLKNVNDDIVGWIQVADTKVDYPVLQAKNNDFYLRRNALKQYAIHGSIFMDATSDPKAESLHTVIYGHNMKDGSMFGSLGALKKADAFHKNKKIIYEYPGGRSEWEIFSVYIYKGSDVFFEFDFEDYAQFSRYVMECAERSMHGGAELLEIPDRLLTLVTCTYEFDNSRLIVHAKPVVSDL